MLLLFLHSADNCCFTWLLRLEHIAWDSPRILKRKRFGLATATVDVQFKIACWLLVK
jgi:hypothetical protein